MLKSIIIFLAGAAVGVGVMYYGPGKVKNHLTSGASQVEHTVKSEIYDRCVGKFYADTNCLQVKPSVVCEEEIQVLCGDLPKGAR